ncbi:hypothetical protein NEMBOFW57_002610 [Staphylotrichum longicolle]|uniref:Uncharacterized protein n=1 Tax=Staphylotrichum longicolle TaxID=669026 RepID=A0AAD4I3T4_9PEZI|nr:hypothetical protein NEMBOFW57_002610 [Staphylotrichum longicolle]
MPPRSARSSICVKRRSAPLSGVRSGVMLGRQDVDADRAGLAVLPRRLRHEPAIAPPGTAGTADAADAAVVVVAGLLTYGMSTKGDWPYSDVSRPP